MEALQESAIESRVGSAAAPRRQAIPDLSDRVVLVTGGARGLGAALCRSLCEAGATVVGADVRSELMQGLSEEVRAGGGSIRAIKLDIADDTQVASALDDIVKRHGRLDVLINNAGVDLTAPVEEIPLSEWERILAVNLTAPFILSKRVFPLMKRQGRGHIVNIASTASKRCWANAAAYHASKWGLVGLSHALHVEARPHNVKVTAVISGGLRTPFLTDRFPDIDLDVLQDPRNVADTVRFVLTTPDETVIPEIMVLPMRETSWP